MKLIKEVWVLARYCSVGAKKMQERGESCYWVYRYQITAFVVFMYKAIRNGLAY